MERRAPNKVHGRRARVGRSRPPRHIEDRCRDAGGVCRHRVAAGLAAAQGVGLARGTRKGRKGRSRALPRRPGRWGGVRLGYFRRGAPFAQRRDDESSIRITRHRRGRSQAAAFCDADQSSRERSARAFEADRHRHIRARVAVRHSAGGERPAG